MSENLPCVYIMTNDHNKVLYTGVTSDLLKRAYEHKHSLAAGFTKQYNVHKLVYFEVMDTMETALNREKQIKAGSRRKKIDLINAINPSWRDLYDEIL